MGRNGRTAESDARRVEALARESTGRPGLSESRLPVPPARGDAAARARIVDALVALVAERGYARTSVSRILELADVSSPVFYELFSDRHDCFLAAFDTEIERVRAHVRDACEEGEDWRERIRQGLTALLELFQDEPHTARVLVVDSLEAGDRVLARRARALSELCALVQAGRHEASDGAGNALSAEEVVHATVSVLEARLREHGVSHLVELVNPLMAIIVLPYHGLRASALELTMPLPAGKRPPGRSPGRSSGESGLPLPPRSLAVLRAVWEEPNASNRVLARRTGITDEGQISRTLRRLEQSGLIYNRGAGKAGANAWTLLAKGARLLGATSELTTERTPKPVSQRHPARALDVDNLN